MAEPYTCSLDPDTNTTLKMYLFKNVLNVEKIRSNIIKGLWNCAVIKPTLILDPFQVAVAANKAAVSAKLECMVTRTVYAEVLYNLSLTKNISQSLSKFGIEKGQDLLVCFLIESDMDSSADILTQIDGEMRPIDELSKFTDMKELKSVYKMNKLDMKDNNSLLDIVVSRMVTKNFVSH